MPLCQGFPRLSYEFPGMQDTWLWSLFDQSDSTSYRAALALPQFISNSRLASTKASKKTYS